MNPPTPRRRCTLDAHTRSLVVVDPTVQGWQALTQDLEPTTALRVMNPQDHGLRQLAEQLDRLQAPLHSIHLIGHGRPGCLRLGSAELDLASLPASAPLWRRVGHALDAEGVLVLYGGELARGRAGHQFVDALAVSTGAEVTASSRRVGAQALGGEGVFDHYSGRAPSQRARHLAARAPQGGMRESAANSPQTPTQGSGR